MSTFKRCSIVILSNKKASKIGLKDGKLYYFDPVVIHEAQHLYILSYEEIKEGDWYYLEELGNIQQLDKFPFEGEKIIATTDKSLELPEPSEGFIKAYIEAYNSGNPITEVDVEYLQYNYPHQPYNFVDHEEIKVNYKDNTITIIKIKDSWNREEVIELLHKRMKYTLGLDYNKQTTIDWIKQNL